MGLMLAVMFACLNVQTCANDYDAILSKGKDYFIDVYNRLTPAWQEASKAVTLDNLRGRVETPSSLCDSYSCCLVSNGDACSISDMPVGETTMVLAPEGSEATCIFGTQYGIQVIPGASNEKLLFYFQLGH